MKRKTLITGLIALFFATLISTMPAVKADEKFFVDFYVADSQGTPLDGVEIEVTGIYNYDEIVYTESNGYAPRLELFSDQRNAHYTWTATYQLDSQSGDFYVPDNYNSVNIVMSDVNTPTPTPSPTPPPTATPSPTPPPTPNPTTSPSDTPLPAPTSTPTVAPQSTPTPTPAGSPSITASPTPQPTQNPTPTPETTPTFLYFAAGTIVSFLVIVGIAYLLMKRR